MWVRLDSCISSKGSSVLFSAHEGLGSFYAVVPYGAMVFPATVMFFYAIFALLAGFVSFWRATRGTISDLLDPRAFFRAVKEAFGLQYKDCVEEHHRCRTGGCTCHLLRVSKKPIGS